MAGLSLRGAGSLGGSVSWTDRLGLAAKLVLCFAVFVTVLQLPIVAADNSHDVGSAMIDEYVFVHGLQVGPDIFINGGPYGFLSYLYVYSGLAAKQKLAFGILYSLTYSLLFIWTIGRFKNWPFRIALTATTLLFSADTHEYIIYTFPEIHEYIFFLMAALLFVKGGASRSETALKILSAALFAILALMKVIFFIFPAIILSIMAVRYIFERRDGTTLAALAVFLAVFALLWFIAGQEPGTFLPFLTSAMAASDLFQDAATLYEPRFYTALGAFVALTVMLRQGALLLAALRARDIGEAGLAALFAFLIFAIWKHGFVRADPHMIKFFFCMIVAAPLLFMVPFRSERGQVWIAAAARSGAALMVVALSYYAIAEISADPRIAATPIPPMQGQIIDKLRHLAHIRTYYARLRDELESNKRRDSYPELAKIIGTEPVDVFGPLPNTAVFSGMTYRGKPMPIRFFSLGTRFETLNADLYRNDERAPRFVIMENRTIDNRFIMQEDSLAWLLLLSKYQVMAVEKGDTLLVRRAAPGPEPALLPLSTAQARFGETIAVPGGGQRPIWMCVDMHVSILGRLLRALYKLPEISIAVTTGATTAPFKFINVRGGSCFIVSPVFYDDADFLAKNSPADDQAPSQHRANPDKIDFSITGDEAHRLFEDRIDLRFYGIEGLPDDVVPAERAQKLSVP